MKIFNLFNYYSSDSYDFIDDYDEEKRIVSSETAYKLGLIGFIVSLCSLILCCGVLSPISFILSIVSITNLPEYDEKGRKYAIAGIVLSSLGLLLGIVALFMALGG